MRLTWRHDGVATALVAGAGAIYGAYEIGSPVAGFGAVRPVSAAVLGLGIAACATGGGAPDTPAGWQTFVAWLGALTFGFAIFGMAAGSVLALRLAIGTTVAIWLLSTVRRACTEPPADVEVPDDARELVGGLR